MLSNRSQNTVIGTTLNTTFLKLFCGKNVINPGNSISLKLLSLASDCSKQSSTSQPDLVFKLRVFSFNNVSNAVLQTLELDFALE